jgi:hypothetical protein
VAWLFVKLQIVTLATAIAAPQENRPLTLAGRRDGSEHIGPAASGAWVRAEIGLRVTHELSVWVYVFPCLCVPVFLCPILDKAAHLINHFCALSSACRLEPGVKFFRQINGKTCHSDSCRRARYTWW